jgi:hypothetical protein
MALTLECHNGLYYCHTDIYTVDPTKRSSLSPLPLVSAAARVITPNTSSSLWQPPWHVPTSKSKQLESKLWLLLLGSPGVTQLDILLENDVVILTEFDHHPFLVHKFKALARTTNRKRRFYMEFSFMGALASDFSRADRLKDHVIFSYDGFSLYLLIADEHHTTSGFS